MFMGTLGCHKKALKLETLDAPRSSQVRVCCAGLQVTLDEFIDGIMRCKGPARAIDQAGADCILDLTCLCCIAWLGFATK